MSGLACPRCGAAHAGAVADRGAEDFCGSCDFPLFFVPVPPPADPPAAEAAAVTAPVAVVAVAALRPCPSCLEPNDPAGVFCTRCGHALDADPGPLFEPDAAAFPDESSPSSAALVVSVLALVVALVALAVALVS